VNSGGTFLASPLLGKWTDSRGVKEALFISLIVMIGGNIMYALSQDVWMLLASRFIVGCAAGMRYSPPPPPKEHRLLRVATYLAAHGVT
jgi:predicted MFS family arabinose efflux permease